MMRPIAKAFVPHPLTEGQEVSLSGDQVHYIRDVLRLKIGDELSVMAQNGLFCAQLTLIQKSKIFLRVSASLAVSKKNYRSVLCQAIPKNQRMDWIIEKCTELGVDTIIPMVSSRVVKKTEKIERWKKLAVSASRQCQRDTPPVISGVSSWNEIVARGRDWDIKLMATVSAVDRSKIFELDFSMWRGKSFSFSLAIGPEGDFDESEIAFAKSHGWVLIDLGPTVLRVETAAIVGVTLIQYELSRQGLI